MREENICKGPGLAGRHGQQLLESKDGADRTGGQGAQCCVLLPGYERGEYLQGARPGWEARPAAVGEQGWCGQDRWTRSPVPCTIYLDMREENICKGPGLAGRHGQQLLESKDGADGTGGQGAQ